MTRVDVHTAGETAAVLTITDEFTTNKREVLLTLQELIDLEGACVFVRHYLEGTPMEAKGEAPDEPEKDKADIDPLGAWISARRAVEQVTEPIRTLAKAAKIDLAELFSERATEPASPEKAKISPKNAKDFFAQYGIDFDSEIIRLIEAYGPVKTVNGQRGHVQLFELPTTVRATNTANLTSLVPDSIPWRSVEPYEIGKLVDRITDNPRGGRSIERIARRALEECVELCLACGSTSQNVLGSVVDSLHNQSLKESAKEDSVTVFPSQLSVTEVSTDEVCKEIADVHLVLADLIYAASLTEQNVAQAERMKFNKLANPTSEFATDGHTFYLRKAHVKDQTPSST